MEHSNFATHRNEKCTFCMSWFWHTLNISNAKWEFLVLLIYGIMAAHFICIVVVVVEAAAKWMARREHKQKHTLTYIHPIQHIKIYCLSNDEGATEGHATTNAWYETCTNFNPVSSLQKRTLSPHPHYTRVQNMYRNTRSVCEYPIRFMWCKHISLAIISIKSK